MTDLDLDFRPDSYWSPQTLLGAVLGGVKGDLRRQMITDLMDRGEEVGEEFLAENLDRGIRSLLEAQSFRWMGGEYLPDHRPGEVEIARLAVASVTQDVVSIRARSAGGRIRYRVVDEYGVGTWEWAPKSSRRPLTTRGLIGLIDGLALDGEGPPDYTETVWWWQRESGSDEDEIRGWLEVSSVFYPGLGEYYDTKLEQLIARWQEDDRGADIEEDSPAEQGGGPEWPASEGDWHRLLDGISTVRGYRRIARSLSPVGDPWIMIAAHGREFSGPAIEEILVQEGTPAALFQNPSLQRDRAIDTLCRVASSMATDRPTAGAVEMLLNVARAGLLAEMPQLLSILKRLAEYKRPRPPSYPRGIAGAFYGMRWDPRANAATAAKMILAARNRPVRRGDQRSRGGRDGADGPPSGE
jgi:hypothetical protein